MLELNDSSGIVFFNALTKEIVTVETSLDTFSQCVLDATVTPDNSHKEVARQLVLKGFLVATDA